MKRIELIDVLKQMEKDPKIYSASRDAVGKNDGDYLITLSYKNFTRQMFYGGFISTDTTIRRKWNVLVSSGILRDASDNYARIDMHAFNEAVGINTHTHTHIHTHTDAEAKEASQ